MIFGKDKISAEEIFDVGDASGVVCAAVVRGSKIIRMLYGGPQNLQVEEIPLPSGEVVKVHAGAPSVLLATGELLMWSAGKSKWNRAGNLFTSRSKAKDAA